jgi:hypothetical protein
LLRVGDQAANAKARFATRSEQYWNITLGGCDFKAECGLTVVSFPLLQIVHSRTATALCLTSVKNEDKHDFSKIVEAVKVH